MQLVVDRFDDFRRGAQQNGLTAHHLNDPVLEQEEWMGQALVSKLLPRRKERKKDMFLVSFMEEVRAVQQQLGEVRRCTEEIESCTDALLQATTATKEKEAQTRLETTIDKGSAQLRDAQSKFQELQAKETGNASEERIKTNMCQALAKKMRDCVSQFQQAQSVFANEMKAKTARQLKIACPEASPQEIEEMMANGENRDTVVRRQMAGSHAVLLESLQQVHDKYKAVRRIERSMADLHQMMQDMAQLIEHQGEILDSIEHNVAKTKATTAQAEKELIGARKAQYQARRRLCCITAFFLVVAVLVLFPVIFAT